MQLDYKPFIDRLINKYEGPYGWNRKDPGGPTKYGITCYDLAEHRGERMDSASHWALLVQAMPLSEAEQIYEHKYAAALRFNDLRAGVDCCFLDYGVNSGIARPVRVARALLGAGTGDRLTDSLVQEINSKDPEWFIESMCEERLHFLKGLKTWGEFGHGWQARVDDLKSYSFGLTHGVVVKPVAPVPSVPKGTHPVAPVGPTVKGSVIGSSGAGATAHAAGLPPWAVGGIIAAGIAGGVALVLWQRHKAVQANAAVVLPPTIRPHP